MLFARSVRLFSLAQQSRISKGNLRRRCKVDDGKKANIKINVYLPNNGCHSCDSSGELAVELTSGSCLSSPLRTLSKGE